MKTKRQNALCMFGGLLILGGVTIGSAVGLTSPAQAADPLHLEFLRLRFQSELVSPLERASLRKSAKKGDFDRLLDQVGQAECPLALKRVPPEAKAAQGVSYRFKGRLVDPMQAFFLHQVTLYPQAELNYWSAEIRKQVENAESIATLSRYFAFRFSHGELPLKTLTETEMGEWLIEAMYRQSDRRKPTDTEGLARISKVVAAWKRNAIPGRNLEKELYAFIDFYSLFSTSHHFVRFSQILRDPAQWGLAQQYLDAAINLRHNSSAQGAHTEFFAANHALFGQDTQPGRPKR